MSGARAAARSVGTLLAAGSLCAMAVAGARKPAPLQDDAAAPIVTAAAPAPIVIDARARPHRFTLDFTLSEESRSSLRVELRPEDAAGSPVVRELTLRFDPFEGARWHWTVRPADVVADLQFDAAMRSATSTPLTQISEPKGLHYRLAFAFHGGGGLSVEFADGAPLLAAQFGATAPLRVTVAPGGGVTALAVTPVEPQGDAALAAALGATTAGLLPWMAPARTDAVPPPAASPLPNSAPPFSRGSLAAAAEAIAPPVAVRPLDPVTAAEGRIARFIVEPRDRVEIPVVVIEPKRRDPARPLVVVACAAPLGKAAPAALQHAAELAARGHAVVAFDLLDGGERRMNQSFDPIDLPELRLVGSSAPAVALEELRQVVAWAATLPAATPDPATPAAELHADADAVRALRGAPEAPRFVALADLSAATTRPSATLADVAVFGEEYLRARYDSDLYHRAVQLRETCSRSDATPLAQRVAAAVPPAAPPAALG
ncbi:MAG: hypothetical protein FJ293_16100, partial [Planctomycetes bacterium]|nr:hypothetical protein [Planctomycetota bacterium]